MRRAADQRRPIERPDFREARMNPKGLFRLAGFRVLFLEFIASYDGNNLLGPIVIKVRLDRRAEAFMLLPRFGPVDLLVFLDLLARARMVRHRRICHRHIAEKIARDFRERVA
jgi:hypothetical protein